MVVQLELLEPAPGGWHLRFHSPDEEWFCEALERIKALPMKERAWKQAMYQGRGAWWLSRRALAEVGPYFANYQAMLAQVGEGTFRNSWDSPLLVIPPQVLAAFAMLSLLPSAPLCVVQASYRALAKGTHPDYGGSEVKMKRLNAAYEVARTWAEAHLMI
jgi:hypothetical protein